HRKPAPPPVPQNRPMTRRMSRTLVRRSIVAVAALLGVAAPRPHVAAADDATAGFASGVVVSVCPDASAVGLSVLKAGGNAVDAAVATAFALAVTYPAAGNIGGGGFMLVHPPKGAGAPTVFEYRETAPAAATVDMYARMRDRYGHKIVGVPGTVRGLELAHQRLGKLPWKDLVAPAV